MNRPGPGPQPLRVMQNNMFQNQQNSSNARGAPVLSARFQNGKLGTSSSWGIGNPLGGAPGLSNTQSRANNGGMNSFAQTIGGSQAHTPLDLSEFPSLSGTQQAQQQTTSSQAIWSNPNIRLAQHTPVQRQQGQGGGNQNQTSQGSMQQTPQAQTPGNDDGHLLGGQLRGNADDYRFGGQGVIAQLSGSTQPQTGNIDEFPPLGAGGIGGGDIGHDRRTGMIQNAAYGGNGETNIFPNLGQTRNGVSGGSDTQQDRSLSSAVSDRSLGAGGLSSSERNVSSHQRQKEHFSTTVKANSRPVPGLGASGFTGRQASQMPFSAGQFRESQQQQQPIGQIPQPNQLEQNHTSDMVESPSSGLRHKRLSEMSDMERFGLPGLLTMIPPDSPDHSGLAVGQDLTVLGLDLNRPDNSPLYPSFGSPFADGSSRPVIPDFALPAAYTVNNVPPLHSKIASFSAETLLAIFYQYPRDIMQEIAAGELYNLDWRWHKVLRQWMMKDPELPPPVPISDKQERGWYLFFDVMNWRRERREFELNYDDLDQRHGSTQAR